MRVLVTAGPTREYIDPVRFITNASSGRMGRAVARAAARRGHEVTLLAGPGAAGEEQGVRVLPFVSVCELAALLAEQFEGCDALVMAAAVGDFRPEPTFAHKLTRRDGPVDLRLVPTSDVLAGLAARRGREQTVVAFALEEGPEDRAAARAREEMLAKKADFVVVNPPGAMASDTSHAAVLSPDGESLGWGDRTKDELAREIVSLLERSRREERP